MDHLIKEKNTEKLLEEVKAWRNRLKIPQQITLSDGDNTLFVNMDSVVSLKTFFSAIAKRSQIVVEEFIYDCGFPFTTNAKNECFANECIVSFYKSPLKNSKKV
jgi:hypothetical protein